MSFNFYIFLRKFLKILRETILSFINLELFKNLFKEIKFQKNKKPKMKFTVCILFSVLLLVLSSEVKAQEADIAESHNNEQNLRALSKLSPELIERLVNVSF